MVVGGRVSVGNSCLSRLGLTLPSKNTFVVLAIAFESYHRSKNMKTLANNDSILTAVNSSQHHFTVAAERNGSSVLLVHPCGVIRLDFQSH
jgi:hypothetical protein